MSGYRCEVPGCRGNRPCPACLVGLSAAMQKGIKNAFPITIPLHKMKPGEFDAFVIAVLMKSVREELRAYWAKTIGDTKLLPAKAGAGLTRVKKTTKRRKGK